jgi:hypothetical protein
MSQGATLAKDRRTFTEFPLIHLSGSTRSNFVSRPIFTKGIRRWETIVYNVCTDRPVYLTCPLSLSESYGEMYHLILTLLAFLFPGIDAKRVWHENNQFAPFPVWLRDSVALVESRSPGFTDDAAVTALQPDQCLPEYGAELHR